MWIQSFHELQMWIHTLSNVEITFCQVNLHILHYRSILNLSYIWNPFLYFKYGSILWIQCGSDHSNFDVFSHFLLGNVTIQFPQ